MSVCPQDFSYDIEEVDLNSAWINDQYKNEYQGVHTHSGREDLGFSSILYLKVPDFGKEITDTGHACNGKTELIGNCGGTWSNPTHLITPKVGDFYIFPYDMQHLVYPFTFFLYRKLFYNSFLSFISLLFIPFFVFLFFI